MNNILKHSKASGASVLIKVNKSEISTVVKDDGIGFNPEENNKGKSYFGLTGMKERVKILKGRMEIKSALQQGTEIVIIIPIIKK